MHRLTQFLRLDRLLSVALRLVLPCTAWMLLEVQPVLAAKLVSVPLSILRHRQLAPLDRKPVDCQPLDWLSIRFFVQLLLVA
jgi:hypothetical protein